MKDFDLNLVAKIFGYAQGEGIEYVCPSKFVERVESVNSYWKLCVETLLNSKELRERKDFDWEYVYEVLAEAMEEKEGTKILLKLVSDNEHESVLDLLEATDVEASFYG